MILNIILCSVGSDQPNAMYVIGRIMVERPRGLRSVVGTCVVRVGSSQRVRSKDFWSVQLKF